MIRLDLCCGNGKQEGFVGMDKRDIPGVDIVHDITVFPWPLEDDSCSHVFMSLAWAIIEPKYRIDVMDEVWRVLSADGTLKIFDTYYLSPNAHHDPIAYSSPNETTFLYFDPRNYKYKTYEPKPWYIIEYAYQPKKALLVRLKPMKQPQKEGVK